MIGMMGRQSTDGVREWWSRLGAWLGIYAAAWMVIAVAAVYGPQWVHLAIGFSSDDRRRRRRRLGRHGRRRALRRQLGNDPGTGDAAKKSTATKVKEVVAVIAPFVFIAGLLIGVAYALDAVILINAGQSWTGPCRDARR